MSDAIYFAPIRTPIVDARTGLMAREWYLFFQALWLRTGGTTGSTDEVLLQSGENGLSAPDLLPSIYGLGQDLGQQPRDLGIAPSVLLDSSPALAFSELEKQIQGLGQAPVLPPQVNPHLEYGSWTPTDASGAGLSLTVTSATYVKHERLVLARCQLTYPATASGANATIGGLPFTVDNIESARQGWVSYGTSAILRYFLPVLNTTTAQLYQSNGAVMTNANMSGIAVYLAALYTTP
jgi:hypothetical protein